MLNLIEEALRVEAVRVEAVSNADWLSTNACYRLENKQITSG